MEKDNQKKLVESVLESGVNYNKHQCRTYRSKVDRSRKQVLDESGKLVMKAALIGVGGLLAYFGASHGQAYDQMTGLANCCEVMGVLCGITTTGALTGLLGVKDSIINIVDNYRNFRRHLRTYEYYHDEVAIENGGKSR